MKRILIIADTAVRSREIATMFGFPRACWNRLASSRAAIGMSRPLVLDAWRPRFPTDIQLATYGDILHHLRRSEADRIKLPEGTCYRVGDSDRQVLRALLTSEHPDALTLAFEAIREIVAQPSAFGEEDQTDQ